MAVAQDFDLLGKLKEVFGFDKFRGVQEDIIKNVMDGNNTFVIMPTGAGKSMCYQLPAILMPGTAVVISPLIALMKNQVDQMNAFGINAKFLNSTLSKSEINRVKKAVLAGETKLLYVAPESLTKEEYITFLQEAELSFVAVDEAHCISEWGHDFRPEYRRIKEIIKQIGNLPIIGLTATATPKVQLDIQKNLGMYDATVFKKSFNRTNLFYEVRPKVNVKKQLLQFLSKRKGEAGIIYCLSRKKTEEIAQLLVVNGHKARPYHAGLEPNTRMKNQDDFLNENTDIICATIAFGMGIDKPDVRFVVHYDTPKSIEGYYQETGRAGRDDGEGYCLAFYAYKDIEKLEKFMSSKPVAEQEIGHALLQEVVGYAETSMNRRKYLLHYFGEDFDEKNGDGADMDDNSRNPKKKHEAKENVAKLLQVVKDTLQKYKSKEVVNTIIGKENALLTSHKTHLQPYFGIGKDKTASYWMALIRQVLVVNFIKKEIEQYGVVKLTEKGDGYLQKPTSFMMTEDHSYNENDDNSIITNSKSSGGVADEKLVKLLRNLRKKVAIKQSVPPFAVFQDPSLDDMALKYPITLEELSKVHGVGEGKARKFGKDFVKLIANYVDENDVLRPDDLIVKSTGVNSGLKLFIIQNTDKKLPLEDIAKSKGLQMSELIKEMEVIIFSGTKLNINYAIDDLLDEDQQEDIHEYFMEAESDDIEEALNEFDGDHDEDELRLMRIKFINEVGN